MSLPRTVVKQSAGQRQVEAAVVGDCRHAFNIALVREIDPRQSILDIPRFLPSVGTSIHCSENTKAAREENAVFSALKSSICASLRRHRRTRGKRNCVTFEFTQFLCLSVR
jgi:hypothetical protein